MPYANSWEKNGLYRKFTDEISCDEILKANIELYDSTDFEYIKYIINDFTEATGNRIEACHAKAYAIMDEVISARKGKMKIAIVVTHPSLIALTNYYCELMVDKRFDCETFQTLSASREWIELKQKT